MAHVAENCSIRLLARRSQLRGRRPLDVGAATSVKLRNGTRRTAARCVGLTLAAETVRHLSRMSHLPPAKPRQERDLARQWHVEKRKEERKKQRGCGYTRMVSNCSPHVLTARKVRIVAKDPLAARGRDFPGRERDRILRHCSLEPLPLSWRPSLDSGSVNRLLFHPGLRP
ncbi:uncharacterized protein BKA78DRAFT_144004 [Phyllosticta capitalensis]|uniref:uncharacterized protein n=1 Tax=Phyllosticta capitalensis TaxID=121624 RepID=UPI00312CE5E1